jgi:3-oxoacyl-(acyl-carrier-protein) synthase
MTTRLDDMISSARELDAAWDITRSERVRDGALRRRDVRVRRDRALRRGLLVASGAGLLVLALLRAASSAPAEPTTAALGTTAQTAQHEPTVSVAPAATAEALALAAHSLSDAGYARD